MIESAIKNNKLIVVYSEFPYLVYDYIKTLIPGRIYQQYNIIDGMYSTDKGYGATSTLLAIEIYTKLNEDMPIIICDLGNEDHDQIVAALEFYYLRKTQRSKNKIILCCKPELGIRLNHIGKVINQINAGEVIDILLAQYKLNLSTEFINYLRTINITKISEALINTDRAENSIRKYIDDHKGSAIVEKIEPKGTIYGLGALEDWLRKRKKLVHEVHPVPLKGISILGIPGTGKTMSSMLASQILEIPLYRFNIHMCLGKYVGQSEANLVKELAYISSLGKCVILLDEVDKLFGKDDENQTGSRVLGILLSYMDTNRDVFWVLTGNNIHDIPPELLRKGRLDEYFYIGLPTKSSIVDYMNYIFSVFETYGFPKISEYDIDILSELAMFKKLLFNDIVALCDEMYLEFITKGAWSKDTIENYISSFNRYELEYNEILKWSEKHAKSAI